MEDQQLLMLPGLVGPLIELILSDEAQIREIGLEMYYSLLQRVYPMPFTACTICDSCRYNTFGSFHIVEKETISTIDHFTGQDDIRVDTNFRPFFTRKLAAKFNEEYP